MTNGKLMEMLIKHAKDYAPDCAKSVIRNKHMNSLQKNSIKRVISDAIIVDFLNYIGGRHCMDLGLYTKDLITNN